jgi:Bacterial Ig-like domain (group 2)
MRISPMSQVCSGLLCGVLVWLAGCGSPSSQNLDSLTVTATPSTLSVGGASILKAVAHLSDGTTQDVTAGTKWTLSNPALANISSSTVIAKAAGALTVQAAYVEATPAGTSPASATVTPQNLSASTQITITAAGTSNVPTITWNAPAAITYGTALSATQLSATANVPGTFAFTPAAGTVLKAGTQTLSAVFTPTDSKTYSAATASVQLTVNQANLVINWPAPAPIPTGTALSATQLDATTTVPGTFMYNPAAGAVLPAGSQQLTAVFSPTDTTDYASATAHTTLTVGSTPSGPVSGPIGPTPVGCGGPTVNVNSAMSTSTLQSTINSAPSCALIVFAAGTYNITSPIKLQCGVTYTGPVANPASAVLNATFAPQSGNIFSLYSGNGYANPCTSPTTIEYLNFKNAGGIYVQTSFTNLTIEYNQFTNIPCCNGTAANVAIDFDGSASSKNTAQNLTNTTIQWNTIGDSTSCTSPTNGMSYTGTLINGGLQDQYAGNCGGMTISSTIGYGASGSDSSYGLKILNNNFFHLGEAIHFGCPTLGGSSQPCEPGSGGSGSPGSGVETHWVTAEFNDFNQIHRMAWEQQPEITQGIVVQYNSIHDFYNPYFGTFGESFACCDGSGSGNGLPGAPYLNNSSNVIVFNTAPNPPIGSPRYGYIIEAWGYNASYANNLTQSGNFSAGAITWGFGGGSWSISNNTMCGSNWASTGYITNEFGNSNPPAQSSNSSACSALTSFAPSISPSAGAQSFPLTVTLTDPGYTSGPQPLGNTGIWYTTDGSTPVPGSGTAQYLASGGSFVLTAPATVKAVGMWGAQNQPSSYQAGYGFVPSSAVTAAYSSASGGIKRPAGGASNATSPIGKVATAVGAAAELSGGAASAALESVAINPSQPVVAIGSTTQLKAVATFDDGSVKDVTTDFGWQSSDARIMTANGSGTLAGVASGKATISGSYGGIQASVPVNSTIGEVVWSDPIVITEGGTYTGNWQSTNAKKPAVTIETTAPVTIDNAHIRSMGGLIKTTVAGTNLTVRNSLGVAVNAGVKGQPNGVFLEVSSPTRLDVENNYIESAQGGVIVHGYGGNRDGGQTIVIRANRARNMNGLLSDGNGGYLPGEGANHSQARFVQFDSVQSVPGIDVGWNEVINYPGQSLVDDNIDLYRSGGTLNQPLEIHDTYIQGAYPYKAAQDAYTGGGIKTDAKAGDNAREVPAFNSIHDNQVVGTVNYGIQFAAGHDNVAANNRVISSGLLGDGSKIAAQFVGMANGDAAGTAIASGSMYNNTMHDNVIGWACWQSSCAKQGYRNDQFFPAAPADYSTNSVVAARQITFDMENSEYQVWLNKMASAGIAVGPSF